MGLLQRVDLKEKVNNNNSNSQTYTPSLNIVNNKRTSAEKYPKIRQIVLKQSSRYNILCDDKCWILEPEEINYLRVPGSLG